MLLDDNSSPVSFSSQSNSTYYSVIYLFSSCHMRYNYLPSFLNPPSHSFLGVKSRLNKEGVVSTRMPLGFNSCELFRGISWKISYYPWISSKKPIIWIELLWYPMFFTNAKFVFHLLAVVIDDDNLKVDQMLNRYGQDNLRQELP